MERLHYDYETFSYDLLKLANQIDEKYDAIVVAVGHEKFKSITTQEYASMSKGVPVVIDVKGIVEKPTWRL